MFFIKTIRSACSSFWQAVKFARKNNDLLHQIRAEQTEMVEKIQRRERFFREKILAMELFPIVDKLCRSTKSLAAAVIKAGGSIHPITKKENPIMASPIIRQLIDQVHQTIGVAQSATSLLNGVAGRIDAAVMEALTNGATAEQLLPLSSLSTELKTETDALAAAVVANTPTVPPSPPAPPPEPEPEPEPEDDETPEPEAPTPAPEG